MAKSESKKEAAEAKQPAITPDVKVNTVAEAAAKIAKGEKIRHPGPWVTIKPREGFSLDEEIIQLQKEGALIGFDPKTGKGILKQ
jgi:hypothetical protein